MSHQRIILYLKYWTLVASICLSGYFAQAQYVKIEEPANGGFNPIPHFSDHLQAQAITLLRWLRFHDPLPQPRDPYNRQLHFGSWKVHPNLAPCLNTRAHVLQRHSIGTLSWGGAKGCSVVAGVWLDRFSGRSLYSAEEVHVDHVVPVKNSYVTGAHTWDQSLRCAYFNFLGNHHHLLPIDVRENLSKADRGPESYLPAQENFHCEYLAYWLKIKMTWSLAMTEPEALAIYNLIQQKQCPGQLFMMPPEQIRQERQAIKDLVEGICKK